MEKKRKRENWEESVQVATFDEPRGAFNGGCEGGTGAEPWAEDWILNREPGEHAIGKSCAE